VKLLITQEELNNLKSRAPTPLSCERCSKTFFIPKNQVLATLKDASRGYKFCSLNCSSLAQRKRQFLKCFHCGNSIERTPSNINPKSFCSRKCSSQYFGNLRRKPKVIKIRKRAILIKLNCSQCQKLIDRPDYEVKQSKTQTFFCCKSCKTQYANLHQIKRKPFSKAEKILSDLIKEHYPNLEIHNNVRNILDGNLEIDIYIPLLKLCIELNGPVHYIPIYGQEKLISTQNKDLQKQINIQRLGYHLVIVDISRINSKQATFKFIPQYFFNNIKPIIDKLVAPLGIAPTSSP